MPLVPIFWIAVFVGAAIATTRLAAPPAATVTPWRSILAWWRRRRHSVCLTIMGHDAVVLGSGSVFCRRCRAFWDRDGRPIDFV